jgi:PAS domain S-box-containing protein
LRELGALATRQPKVSLKNAAAPTPLPDPLSVLSGFAMEEVGRYRAAFERSAVGMTLFDRNGGWLRVNDAVCRMLGYSREELRTRTAADITFPGDAVFGPDEAARLLDGRLSTYVADKRYLRADGSTLWVSLTISLVQSGPEVGECFLGVIADISQRKQAERTAGRFQFAIEKSTDFIAMCDLHGRPFFVNAAGLRMVGLADLAAAQTVRVADFFFPEDQRFIVGDFLPRVLREGAASVEIRFRHFVTGEPIWVNYNVVTLSEHGTPSGFATISQNVTERKRAEERLRDSEDRMRTILESLPHLVWSCTGDGYCDYLSPQWQRFTGVPAEQHFGIGWTNAVHPDDRPRTRLAWEQAVARGSSYRIEYRLRAADGTYHWHTATGIPVRNSHGAITRWFGANTDIDDRIRAEALVRESSERLAAALSASRTGTFRWNIVTNELEWDEELDRLFGLEPGSTARSLTQFIELVHEDDRPRVIAACRRCAGQGADFHEEFRVVWRDGSVRWLEDKGRTFFGESGKPAYMTGACIDVTTRRLAEEELREARNRLQEHATALESKVEERTASLRKAVVQMEEFSYSVSHDLRAPIRAMNQYAKLLAADFGPVLGETGLHYVNRIIRGSERMNQLTLDTLALSRVTREPVCLAPVSLDTLVSDLVAENPALQSPRADVVIEYPLGLVHGTPSLLTQSISNLLVNAAKFVPAGQVPRIRIWTEVVENRPRLYVRDNGIGIPPEQQARLFGIFERLHDGYEGTGIGLAIVRKAVERIGGAVGVTSDGKHGSTFWLEFQPVTT